MEDMVSKNKFDPVILNHVKAQYDLIKAHTEIRRPMLTANLGLVVLDYMRLEDIEDISDLFEAIHNGQNKNPCCCTKIPFTNCRDCYIFNNTTELENDFSS